MHLGPWTLTADEIRGPEPLDSFRPVSESLPFPHSVVPTHGRRVLTLAPVLLAMAVTGMN